MLLAAAAGAAADWGWVPWVLTGTFGITTLVLGGLQLRRGRNEQWLTSARREIDPVRTAVDGLRDDLSGVKAEVSGAGSELAGLQTDVKGMRSELGSMRNEVTALITSGRSETLLAVGNARNDALLAVSGIESRVQRVEDAVHHTSDQLKVLQQSVEDGFARVTGAPAIPAPPYGAAPPAGAATAQRTGAEAERS